MAAKPDNQLKAAPPGLVDYVVRFAHERRPTRTAVFRATSQVAAVELALDAVLTGRWQGWAILDVFAVEERPAAQGSV